MVYGSMTGLEREWGPRSYLKDETQSTMYFSSSNLPEWDILSAQRNVLDCLQLGLSLAKAVSCDIK